MVMQKDYFSAEVYEMYVVLIKSISRMQNIVSECIRLWYTRGIVTFYYFAEGVPSAAVGESTTSDLCWIDDLPPFPDRTALSIQL